MPPTPTTETRAFVLVEVETFATQRTSDGPLERSLQVSSVRSVDMEQRKPTADPGTTQRKPDRFATWRSLLTETPLPASDNVANELQRLVVGRCDGQASEAVQPAP